MDFTARDGNYFTFLHLAAIDFTKGYQGLFLAQNYLTMLNQITSHFTKQYPLHLTVLVQNKVNVQVAKPQNE